ncbi:MAG: hypothetical protein ACK4MT_04730 [Thermaurantiacus tibetensis]
MRADVMLRALALLFIALSALVPGTARADGFLHGSFLLVDERGDGRYWLSAELPESVAAPEQLGLPDTCHTETTSTRREAGRLVHWTAAPDARHGQPPVPAARADPRPVGRGG